MSDPGEWPAITGFVVRDWRYHFGITLVHFGSRIASQYNRWLGVKIATFGARMNDRAEIRLGLRDYQKEAMSDG